MGILVLFIMLLVGTRVGANSGELTCTKLSVVDAEGNLQVVLDWDAGGGYVSTFSPEGKTLVALSTTTGGEGTVRTCSPEGKPLGGGSATASTAGHSSPPPTSAA